MVFIMPASSIARLLLLLIISMPIYAETFSVDYARVTKIGNGYVLNARINYPLTARVKEAIANSVPIVFSQQIKLIRQTPLLGKYWIWEQTPWLTEIRHEIRYHALSQQYVLRDLDTQNQNTYPTLNDAMQALGSIYLSLPPEHLAEIKNLSLQIRSELDLYALPTPMRPGALLSKKWQLASPWVNAQWD
jgi:hypothetical protein